MWVLRARLSSVEPDLDHSSVRHCCKSCHFKQTLCSATSATFSVWKWRIHLQLNPQLGCGSVRKHPPESHWRSGIAPCYISLRRTVVGKGDGVTRTIRVWHVPPPHEDNRVSWPHREIVRCACDDTELEHHHGNRTYLEDTTKLKLFGGREKR